MYDMSNTFFKEDMYIDNIYPHWYIYNSELEGWEAPFFWNSISYIKILVSILVYNTFKNIGFNIGTQ